MKNYLLEQYNELNYKVEELEEKIEKIKEVLDRDDLGVIGNIIKYEILEVIEPKEDDKQLKLKGW